MKINGGIGISRVARSVLLGAADPKGGEHGPERLVVHGKSNVGP
jgi:hypothetical protein